MKDMRPSSVCARCWWTEVRRRRDLDGDSSELGSEQGGGELSLATGKCRANSIGHHLHRIKCGSSSSSHSSVNLACACARPAFPRSNRCSLLQDKYAFTQLEPHISSDSTSVQPEALASRSCLSLQHQTPRLLAESISPTCFLLF